jgi:hypothetical protein
MVYFSTTGDLVALLSIIATLFYLLYSLQALFIKDTYKILSSKQPIVLSSIVILILHYLMAINSVFIQEPNLNDSSNFIWWANAYAIDFENIGVVIQEDQKSYYFTIGAQLFKQFLSLFSLIFGTSTFFFSCLTISIFTFTIIFYLKICVLLDVKIRSGWNIILFGAIPSFLLITIVPYREIFTILFLMISIYYGFKFRLELRFLYLVYSIISIVLFGIFHYVHMAMAPFLIVIIILIPTIKKFLLKQILLVALFSFIFISIVLFSRLDEYLVANGQVGHVFDLFRADTISRGKILNGFIEKINNHNNVMWLSPGNTDYYWILNDSSFFSLIYSFFQCLIFYMFKPFIWEVQSLGQLILSLEGILRFFLIMFSIIFVFKSKNQMKGLYFLLLLIYFFIETIWALGTVNAGTASRHHLVALWIIVLLGGSGLIEFIKYIVKNLFDFVKINFHQIFPKKLIIGK